MIISAFYSALRGGRTFALALCEVVHEQGWGHYVERYAHPASPTPLSSVFPVAPSALWAVTSPSAGYPVW